MLRRIVLSLMALLLSVTAVQAETLKVAADATWPPMEFLDKEKQLVGYSIDFIKAAAQEGGFDVDVKNTAWDGIFAALQSNQCDVIASSVTITDKRKKAYDFSEPYALIRQAVVVPHGSTIKSMADLEGKTVGGQIGTTGLIQALPKHQPKAVVKKYDEVGLALEDLANGRLDAVICDDPVARYYANKKEEYRGKMHVAFITDDNEEYGFAVRKGDTKTLDMVNKGIKAMRAKGLDKQIEAKWLGQ